MNGRSCRNRLGGRVRRPSTAMPSFFQFVEKATDVRSARALLAAKHGEDLSLLGAIAAARAGTLRMAPRGRDSGVGGIAPRMGASWASRGRLGPVGRPCQPRLPRRHHRQG